MQWNGLFVSQLVEFLELKVWYEHVIAIFDTLSRIRLTLFIGRENIREMDWIALRS